MKIIGKVITGICALFLLWAFFSWVDVVSDNCSPNPQHSDLNLFVLMTGSAKEDEPEAESGSCGNPLDYYETTMGWIVDKTNTSIIFQTEDGNQYEALVGNVNEFRDGYYVLMMKDDVIEKAFVEVW